MNLQKYTNNQEITEPSVVTIGSFDGVHLGHQALFKEMIHYAKKHHYKSVVITFNPHPQEVLKNKTDFFIINSFEQVLKLLETFGIDMVFEIPFSKDFSQKSALNFFKDDILSKINVKAVFVGPKHHFGKQREGDATTLAQICQEKNILLSTTPEFKMDGVEVRSTLIRKYLSQNDRRNAEKLMGHNTYNQRING